MKGVIIAGGSGTRLRPLTNVVNKQLLPVYNQPLVYYPLKTLIDIGIKDILIVSGVEHAGQFLYLLGSGSAYGVHLTYKVQDEPKGIAQAVGLAQGFASGSKVVVILGDNIFEDTLMIKKTAAEFLKQERGSRVFLKRVADPKRFGVATIKGNTITKIEEKPKRPQSNFAVTGLYMYDEQLFDVINSLKPSARGEYEISDVNNFYVKQGTMGFQIVKGQWIDAGTFDSLLLANNFIAKKTITPIKKR